MAPALFDIEPLFELISTSTRVLTPNRRLATHMQTAYDAACVNRGLQSWEAPHIYPFDDWIQQCWQQLISSNSPLTYNLSPLDSLHETLLWERIIRTDGKSILLKPYATAKQAQAAWRTLQLWQCEISKDFYFHPDCQRFAHWATQFEAHCKKQKLINAGEQTLRLLKAFATEQLTTLDHILLVGFQHLPPLYEKLTQQAAKKRQIYQPETPYGVNYQLSCESYKQEIQLAAQWAHQQLKQNAQQRLAIIAPDLAQQRREIEQALTAIFEPQYWLPSTSRYQLPFNISAGTPLSRTPLITSGLDILELLRKDFSYQTLYALLKSPFLAIDGDDAFDAATPLELFLRNEGWPTFSLSQLISQITSNTTLSARYINLLDSLHTASALQKKHADKQIDTQQWVTVFESLLKAFNWPLANRRLDSIEYQQFNRWQQVLNQFASLSSFDQSIGGKVAFEDALKLLTRLLSTVDFQAQTPQTPIQVLGMLEGGGLQFDAVWLLGMNDNRWPAQATPNPFIPIRLQQALNMPHASPEKELAFARELLSAYRQSSPLLIASHATNSDDQPLRASALLDSFEQITTEQLGLQPDKPAHPYYAQLGATEPLEQYPDNCGPALNVDSEQITGGSAILKDQAACPFRAFARYRLGADALPEPSYHLDAAQRGTLLHRALEQLWNRLKNSTDLLTTDEIQLGSTITEAVSVALEPIATRRQDLFGICYTHNEIARLSELLRQWLELEKQRAPFEVLATEKTLHITLQGLPLRIRIDRIDRLDNNSLLLIDYKTGVCSTAKWQGERLEEPQLPLYSICMADAKSADAVQALAFARINIDQLGFVGISSHSGVAPGISELNNSRGWNPALSWADVNQQWQQALESLATEFIGGHALVSPAKKSTCQYCHLHSLCRIHQREEQSNG